MNVEIGTETRYSFSVNICFEISVFCLCSAAVLIGWDPRNSPPSPRPSHLGSYRRALLVSRDRRPYPYLNCEGVKTLSPPGNSRSRCKALLNAALSIFTTKIQMKWRREKFRFFYLGAKVTYDKIFAWSTRKKQDNWKMEGSRVETKMFVSIFCEKHFHIFGKTVWETTYTKITNILPNIFANINKFSIFH